MITGTETGRLRSRDCFGHRAAVLGGLLALVLMSGFAAAAERQSLGAKLGDAGFDTVRLRRTGQQHLFIFGQVEGRRRSCLVDTGWSFTTVSTNTAGRLVASNAVQQLKLGRVVLTNVPVVVSDLRVNGQPTAYDVVLGCDFLLRHQAIVDCGGDRLFLRRAEVLSAHDFDLGMFLSEAGWVEIPLQQRTPPAVTIAAHFNGQATELLVDSGAMWSCLDQRFAAAAGLRARASLNRMTGPAVGQQRAYAVADVKSWSLGLTPRGERTFAVFDLADWGLGAGGKLFPDVAGILGGAELKVWEALIDCGNRKLWVRRKG
jgi:predicted aspartyl protease